LSVGSPQDHRLSPWGRVRAGARSRPLRRLIFAVVVLVIADRFEPAALRSLEEARYENPARDFRFESSDLFGLGPLVAYLRDHPQGRRQRVLFFGNSMIYGYFLGAADALPAQYQRLTTSAKVFNVGINGDQNLSPFLIMKAAIDSVDQVYVLLRAGNAGVSPILPELVPVEDSDLRQFHLAKPNSAERALTRAVDHWRLYRDAYRWQAAFFGTSTRQYIYLHKMSLVRGLIASVRATPMDRAPSSGTVTVDAPVSDAMPDTARQAQLRGQISELWQFADLAMNRRKRVVFLYWVGHSDPLPNAAIGDFNRVFAPYARVLVLHIPAELTFDGVHLTSAGAGQVARALWTARPEALAR
jgi:hypothetical protein